MNDDDILANQATLQRIREAELASRVQYALDVSPCKVPCPICGAHMVFTLTKLTEEVDGRIFVRANTACVKCSCEGDGMLILPDELAIDEYRDGKQRTLEGSLQNEIPEYKWGSD